MLVKPFTFKLLLICGINNSVNSDLCFVNENAFGKLWIKRGDNIYILWFSSVTPQSSKYMLVHSLASK